MHCDRTNWVWRHMIFTSPCHQLSHFRQYTLHPLGAWHTLWTAPKIWTLDAFVFENSGQLRAPAQTKPLDTVERKPWRDQVYYFYYAEIQAPIVGIPLRTVITSLPLQLIRFGNSKDDGGATQQLELKLDNWTSTPTIITSNFNFT